jgi:AcrR family transcriptional regulator
MSSQNTSPTAKAPQRRRGKERVAALMAAGAAVFGEKGFDGATMTEIAARAGAAIGSLYQFFPTKDVLAEAISADDIAGLLGLLDDLAERPPAGDAAFLIDLMFDRLGPYFAAHPAFVALAERRAQDKATKLATRAAMRASIARLLTRATPPLAATRAAIMAIVVLDLMKTMVTQPADDDPATRDLVREELRAMLRQHLTADDKPASHPHLTGAER